jgi:hypothetical protein
MQDIKVQQKYGRGGLPEIKGSTKIRQRGVAGDQGLNRSATTGYPLTKRGTITVGEIIHGNTEWLKSQLTENIFSINRMRKHVLLTRAEPHDSINERTCLTDGEIINCSAR